MPEVIDLEALSEAAIRKTLPHAEAALRRYIASKLGDATVATLATAGLADVAENLVQQAVHQLVDELRPHVTVEGGKVKGRLRL